MPLFFCSPNRYVIAHVLFSLSWAACCYIFWELALQILHCFHQSCHTVPWLLLLCPWAHWCLAAGDVTGITSWDTGMVGASATPPISWVTGSIAAGEEGVEGELVLWVPLLCLGFSGSGVPQLWVEWGDRIVSASISKGMRWQVPLLLLPSFCGCGHHCGWDTRVVSIASPDAIGFFRVAGLATKAEGLGSQALSTFLLVLPALCVPFFTLLDV